MKKAEAEVPMVKIKAIHAIGMFKLDDEGKKYYHIHIPGEVLSVTEEMAREFCDKTFKTSLESQIQFIGDIQKMRPTVVRAVRI